MIKLISEAIIWGVTPEYNKCYSDMELTGYASMNCCCGKSGGTKFTYYLSETCISCPYLVLGCNPIRKEKTE